MTDWESYRSYQCKECNEYCINKLGESWTNNDLCRSCNITALEDAPPLDTSEQRGERPPAMGVRGSSAAHTPDRRDGGLLTESHQSDTTPALDSEK